MFWLGAIAAYAFLLVCFVAWLVVEQTLAAIDEGYIAITKHVGLIRADVFVKTAHLLRVRAYRRVTWHWRLLITKRGAYKNRTEEPK